MLGPLGIVCIAVAVGLRYGAGGLLVLGLVLLVMALLGGEARS